MADATTMPAVIKNADGVEGIEVGRVPVPIAGAGQAVVDVLATGICGTDVHIAHDEYAHERPVVMGHEVLGAVSSVGSAGDGAWV
ncbi:alcohol dehydrogenase catalytic domain-containing protein, partial [Microbacterium sp. Bi121]